MPGYIGITPQYNPITIDEFLKVPTMVMTAYDKAESNYYEAANKADALKLSLGARDADNEEGWKIIDKYEGLLSNAADAIVAGGIQGPESYRQAKNAGIYYNSYMKPLERAIKTQQGIALSRAKDADKGIIGAQDISINWLLAHPEYDASTDKASYSTGLGVYKAASDMFKGLNQFDTTPVYEQSADGKFVNITIPQSYSMEDIYTAFTGEGNGNPTQELLSTVKNLKSKYKYDSLNDEDKESFIYYAMQGAAKSVKPAKVATRNVPRNARVSSNGTVTTSSGAPQFKGYTSITTDDGEILYKNNSQYYRAVDNGEGKYNMVPVTDEVNIGGKPFLQKDKAAPGTLIPRAESTMNQYLGNYSFSKTADAIGVNNIPMGYVAKSYNQILNLKDWKTISTQIKNKVTAIMKANGINNYTFNPSDIEIYVKNLTDNNAEDIRIRVKNPLYKAPANKTSGKQQNNRGADFK